MSATIATKGLGEATRFFAEFPDISMDAAVLAINQVANGTGLVTIKRQMRKEVNFPTGYLEGGRLSVVRKATRNLAEAVIRGRDRATSLARFAPGATPENTKRRGVRVIVKPGRTRVLKKGFIVRLRNGNLGLAVRVKPGETLNRSDKAVRLANNLYLLYGPSVDQVFAGVAEQQAPVINDLVVDQFFRQFTRLARG